MFTGIVENTAKVASFQCQSHGYKLKIITDKPQQNLQIGASISINGVCLTVIAFSENVIEFDVIEETLNRTTLAELKINDEVNFERSVKFGDEIGGHIVAGHIWCKAQVIAIEQQSYCLELTDQAAMKYIFEKGFIAINGASLTIGTVSTNSFWIHLIPETQAITNLKYLAINSSVNIELDSQTQTIVDTITRMNLPHNIQ